MLSEFSPSSDDSNSPRIFIEIFIVVFEQMIKYISFFVRLLLLMIVKIRYNIRKQWQPTQPATL